MADRLTGMLVFSKAAELRSFAAAADHLGMSAQMAGRHVADLEHRLGTRLLNRFTHNQSLTEAGQIFLEGCRRVLAEVEAVEGRVADHAGTPRGTLRISAPAGIGSILIASRLRTFLELYPELRVELVLSDRLVNLIEEQFDVAVWVGDMPDSTLRMRVIGSFPIVTCASRGYLELHGTPQVPLDLARHHCIDRPVRLTVQPWTFALSEQVLDLRPAARLLIDNDLALMEAALASSGIIRIGKPLVRRHLESGDLVQVLASFEQEARPLRLVFSPQRLVSPKLRVFIDWLTESLSELR